MVAAFALLTTLIAATPAFYLADGLLGRGVLGAWVALILALAARSIPPGESRHISRLLRPVIVVLAIPAAWMIVQAAPMPFASLGHPVWQSAEAALGRPLSRSISADPASTMLALAQYLGVAGTIVATAAVTIDRRRAERILFLLTAITALQALAAIVATASGYFQSYAGNVRALLTAAAIGAPISAAAAGHLFEYHERHRSRPDFSFGRFVMVFAACAAALSICLAALIYAGPPKLVWVAILALAIEAGVVVIRRLGAGGWVGAVSGAALLIAIAAFLSTRTASGDLTWRFSDAPARSTAIAEIMTADTSWAGSGAGTYAALAPIYRSATDSRESSKPPTTAATIVFELGRPALWAVGAMVAWAIWQLLRGALARGRDSFHAIAGASVVVVLALDGFLDTTVLVPSIAILAASAVGLGLAQSVSRSVILS